MDAARIGVVVIGRNEGERLKRCLQSIPAGLPVVYVDSGSTDGSVVFAHSIGVTVVELDMQRGFTAARARNAGWRDLLDRTPDLGFVQFVDGDCEVASGWLDQALQAIQSEPNLAVVFGRRRERFPEKSIYNKLCDDEWNVPIGLVASCGGDALFRIAALQQAGGYCDELIAGEEPDLCLRIRRLGWSIRRIAPEMTLHDAHILTFGSWWKRVKRSGFAYAEHVWRHRTGSIPEWRRQLLSILFWGLLLPATVVAIVFALSGVGLIQAGTVMVTLTIVYTFQISRIAWRKRRAGSAWSFALPYGGLLVAGKFAEITGVLQCCTGHVFGRRQRLIEYK